MPAPMWPLGRPFLQGTVARAALAGALSLLALPALEMGYRLQTHRPVLTAGDWRGARIEAVRYGERGRFDAELGWAPKDGFESPGYNTLDYGIRRNLCETDIRKGGILAVGDVYALGGIEVADGETWPAHLERITGLAVLNAGVEGYATDQAILRAEKLLPVLAPKTVVVGIYEEMIWRTRYASFGRPRPYFTVDGGALVLHPPTALPDPLAADATAALRAILGHSAVLDAVLARAAPGYWLGSADPLVISTVDTDPVAVTCGLLQRLKVRADAQGVRVLVLMQYARRTVAESAEPHADVQRVAACARAMGIDVVDQLAALRAVAAASAAALDALYLPKANFGQMSAKGNRATAELIAGALGKAAVLDK